MTLREVGMVDTMITAYHLIGLFEPLVLRG